MTIGKDVKWVSLDGDESCEPLDPEADQLAATGRLPAGRVIHDERGNAVWKWAGSGDSSSTGTSSGILKYIDPRDLNVVGQDNEAKGLVGPGGMRARPTDSGGGYDPYNQSEPKKTAASGKSVRLKR